MKKFIYITLFILPFFAMAQKIDRTKAPVPGKAPLIQVADPVKFTLANGLQVFVVKNTKLPTVFDFRTHIEHRSLYTTPPTFNCYLAYKMFAWILQQGGVHALYAINQQKAAALYQYIDKSSFYTCSIEKAYRSLFNVCFNLPNTALEKLFVEDAKKSNLYGLQGHRAVGGLRASLYNAMPMSGVENLIDFMQDFALRCG